MIVVIGKTEKRPLPSRLKESAYDPYYHPAMFAGYSLRGRMPGRVHGAGAARAGMALAVH